MNWLWFAGAGIVWVLSAACIIGTLYEVAVGKTTTRRGADFWGAVVFHGGTAVLALWLLLKGLGRA